VVVSSRGWSRAMRAGPPQGRALAQFLLGPVVGLFLNADLDQLASHLVTQCSGDGFQLRELGTARKPLGIEFSRQFPSDLAQAGIIFRTTFGGILAHVRGPLQIANQIERKTTDFNRQE
jgi:hypothetical protein